MNNQVDRLYELLPIVYRQRDALKGYPLRALLQVIAEQVNIVEADMNQLYENWFIETSEDWIVPYIGDLVGYRIAHEAGPRCWRKVRMPEPWCASAMTSSGFMRLCNCWMRAKKPQTN
jgi:hypothetical protein